MSTESRPGSGSVKTIGRPTYGLTETRDWVGAPGNTAVYGEAGLPRQCSAVAGNITAICSNLGQPVAWNEADSVTLYQIQS